MAGGRVPVNVVVTEAPGTRDSLESFAWEVEVDDDDEVWFLDFLKALCSI